MVSLFQTRLSRYVSLLVTLSLCAVTQAEPAPLQADTSPAQPQAATISLPPQQSAEINALTGAAPLAQSMTPLQADAAAAAHPATQPNDGQPLQSLAAPSQPEVAAYFSEATAHYEAGQYTQAATQLARIASVHPSASVYYNLGNSYFRLGQYGQAIAAYEKARALSPSQPEVLANLQRAKEAARLSEPAQTRWEHYARRLGPNDWTLLLAVSFWAALGLWLVPAQFRRPHGIWRPALLALAVTVLVLSALGLYPWRQLSRAGTVLEADSPLLLAPVSTSPVQSYAQAGQSARLLGSHGQFDRIALPDGSEGWIARNQFTTIWQQHR